MPDVFYDGLRMRSRYPGERKRYSGIDIIASFVLGAIALAGTIIADVLRSELDETIADQPQPTAAVPAASTGLKLSA